MEIQNPSPSQTVSTLIENSRQARAQGDFSAMLALARQAAELAPADFDALLYLAECELLYGNVSASVVQLEKARPLVAQDADGLQRIAELFTQCSRFEDAHSCHERTVKLKASDPRYLYNLAASCVALGKLERAEQLFNDVIRLNPKDYDAWQNRSTLRRQTPENNHVAQLQYVLEHLEDNDPGRIAVCYALAKELEDIKRYEESFRYLQQGAHARRVRFDYDVASDIEAMQLIQQTFNSSLLRSAPPAEKAGAAVFVLGLPRSGTTLVDRIICAHSEASSLGEINTLPLALMRTVADQSSGHQQPQSKADLISRSAHIDFQVLGMRYLSAISSYGNKTQRLVDKTPLNFLYLGLLRMSLPQARIIHVRRNPVDSCYAIYKTLFRMGYPFSYSLQDVGRYYIAYQALMAHWHEVAPGYILDVDYERLVSHQESESRRILEWCELPWEDSCLNFHQFSGPSATASAAQVRQPMYSSSVGKWRAYKDQLAPFVARLREHGVCVD